MTLDLPGKVACSRPSSDKIYCVDIGGREREINFMYISVEDKDLPALVFGS